MEIKLFEKWMEGGGGPKASAELSSLTGVDGKLLSKLSISSYLAARQSAI